MSNTIYETEYLRLLSEAVAQFNATCPLALTADLVTPTFPLQHALCLGPAQFTTTLKRDADRNKLLLTIASEDRREKTLMIETLPAYFESSCRARIHRCIATVDGWVRYIPKFREWWRSASNAHNASRLHKVSDLRGRPTNLGTYELEAFDFDFGATADRYFVQITYNPDKGYLCMTLNDSHNPTFWWNFLINTGPNDAVSAHDAIAECLGTLEGFEEV